MNEKCDDWSNNDSSFVRDFIFISLLVMLFFVSINEPIIVPDSIATLFFKCAKGPTIAWEAITQFFIMQKGNICTLSSRCAFSKEENDSSLQFCPIDVFPNK